MENEFIEKTQQEAIEAVQAEKTKKKKKKKKEKPVKSTKRRVKANAFVQILNGDFLSRDFILGNLNFIFFLFFLLILMVGKGYYGKKLSSRVAETQDELDEMTGEYFEAKARLEENTQRSILIKKLENTELKETTNPTKVIRIRKEKGEQ